MPFVEEVERLRARLQGNFDVYNLFNASSVLVMNSRIGSQWQFAQQVLGGRLLKFGAQVNF